MATPERSWFNKLIERCVPHRRTIVPGFIDGDNNEAPITEQGECYYDPQTNRYYGINGEGPTELSSELPKNAFRPIRSKGK